MSEISYFDSCYNRYLSLMEEHMSTIYEKRVRVQYLNLRERKWQKDEDNYMKSSCIM